MGSSRLLNEMFGALLAERTPSDQAEREVNSAQSVFGRGPRPADPRFKKAQSDLDRSRSVARTDEDGPGASGLRVTGDKATLGALQDALQEAATLLRDNEDLAEWCDKSYKAIAMGMRKGDTVTLPAFQETPDVGSFNDDDAGIGPDEEGY